MNTRDEETRRRRMREDALFFYRMWEGSPPPEDEAAARSYWEALVDDLVRACAVFDGDPYFGELLTRAFLKLEEMFGAKPGRGDA